MKVFKDWLPLELIGSFFNPRYNLLTLWNLRMTFVIHNHLCCPQVAERIAQLQEALLHCGKFQDALEPLLSWLSDTEELVANQKPPSAEYRVVKAQIQEQKVREGWERRENMKNSFSVK